MNLRTRPEISKFLLVSVMVIMASACTAVAEKNYFPSFADKHTVGLWLFDETDYPYTTLTDAGAHEYDLRLMKGARLVKGKYGNCLKCTPGLDYGVSYAAWKGAVGFYHMREPSGRPGSGLFGPTIAPEQIAKTFAESDWTCEFWLLLMSNPIQDVVIIDLGNKLDPGFKVTLKKGAKGFIVENAYGRAKAECPMLLGQVWGRAWHHIALTYSVSGNELRYYIDGELGDPVKVSRISKSQVPVSVRPESIIHTTHGIFEKDKSQDQYGRGAVADHNKRIRHRFNFVIGHDRRGKKHFNGNIDELRFSDVIRYNDNFPLPDSISRNHRKNAPKPAVANGQPLLFGADKKYLPNQPVMLGSRKHVFIDEVMVDRKENIKSVLNRAGNALTTNIKAAWDASFFQHQGRIYTVVAEGYECDEGAIRLLVSDDGLNFEEPYLGLIEYRGSKNNNLVMLGLPSWGKYFKDTNPACPPEELFKATLWVAQRGIYMYFSPDAVHWRRNETCMLPLVSGGGCETYWDDQQGMYMNYIKRDGSYNTGQFPNYGRSTTMFKSRQPNRTWPFNPVPDPYFEGWPFPCVTGEGITVMGPELLNPNKAQIFRTRPQKYEWAPDVYMSFMFRSHSGHVGVSRDGMNWKIRPELNYMPLTKCHANQPDWSPETYGKRDQKPSKKKSKKETLIAGKPVASSNKGMGMANGIIRRGDEIWQYANCDITGDPDATIRLTQRLDGFISLDAAEKPGVIITRPFIFQGKKLTLNVNAAKGSLKVAILDLPGQEITGHNVGLTNSPKKGVRNYSITHCDPITTDSVRQVVTWKGNSDLGNLAGKVVRLRIEMQNAKLYAFKFENHF
ncbi:MAG: LamG-like jellyroll fold domain-containing protein [Planctomycetota bacterium]